MQQKDSADEFLKQNYGAIWLQKVQTSGALAPILEARFAEAIRCLKADSPLAVVFHCGSILDGDLVRLR